MDTDRRIQRSLRFTGRTRNLPWYPRTGTRDHLAILLGRWGFNEGLEVGTYKGRYARMLTEHNPKLHLTCVDPWRAYSGWDQATEDGFHAEALRALAGRNVTIVRKPSLEAVDGFADASLDFVFIDGDHVFDAAVQDIIRWAPKVRIQGIVMVHDYWITGVGVDVVRAVDAYVQSHDIRPWYITNENVAPTAFWVRK